ncbi:hypothetical protein AAW14_19905 [Streptomyces hygroscopicus]|uniref:hypothetical protein n=1 Tax=Streptomyces hygroscopicus TaxID=1912 RepID=UPI00224063D1|nr:hypothetical protein [Streptomyces hygroscopicus]MCW7944271.1 hypothetical protein [Streptomyces hygroscopicus]
MINYDGKRFRKVLADPAGDAPAALYRQQGDLVWAEFAGGDVRRGSLAGTRDADGVISFSYSMVLDDGRVISGHSVNTPEVLPDGRIRLHERWERFGAHADNGVSYLEEVR